MNNWSCRCGYEKNTGKFCENCGEKKREELGSGSENCGERRREELDPENENCREKNRGEADQEAENIEKTGEAETVAEYHPQTEPVTHYESSNASLPADLTENEHKESGKEKEEYFNWVAEIAGVIMIYGSLKVMNFNLSAFFETDNGSLVKIYAITGLVLIVGSASSPKGIPILCGLFGLLVSLVAFNTTGNTFFAYIAGDMFFNLQHIACALAIASPFISKLIGKIMEKVEN